MAYSNIQWKKAQGYYEAGLTLAKIKEKTGIARNTISQRAKREQWEHGANVDYIEAKELISERKGTKKEHLINIADEIADERIQHTLFFNNSAMKNQKLANKAIKKIDEEKIDEKSLYFIDSHSKITQRNKETVLGKDKTTEINNTNANQNNFTPLEISKAIADGLPD